MYRERREADRRHLEQMAWQARLISAAMWDGKVFKQLTSFLREGSAERTGEERPKERKQAGPTNEEAMAVAARIISRRRKQRMEA